MRAGTRWVWLGLAVALGASVGAALVAGVIGPATPAGSTVKVALVIGWNATAGAYGFNSASLHVPAGAAVDITITNYDPETHSVSGPYCWVNGTIGGMMGYRMGFGAMGMGMMHEVHYLGPSNISHTFTISQGGYGLNVPIPPAGGPADPAVVEFTFPARGPGEVVWMCEAMAGETAFGGPGSMMGHLFVD